ncbi:STAS-like domain-containing protein [Acetobacter senegalensis]|uniref:STAS-like domain-containing protein n=1 Tax=Acetobacter senegalensis TaxID=446692 RepID=UPI001EDB80D7|nr:DUF4325 domain-containing protein [Acetobacter senegalensis]MCG4261381.1 STAS-like domain-containing protein [Acetobacter senegalensis]
MTHVLKLFSGNEFLGGRHVAFVIRTQACKFLEEHPQSKVVLDFQGVRGVSHSFSDELLSPLSDMLGAQAPDHVEIVNCDEMVEKDLKSVARLHNLHTPLFEEPKELCFS